MRIEVNEKNHKVLVYGPTNKRAVQNAEEAEMTPKEFLILLALAKAKGNILTRDEIKAVAWKGMCHRFDTRTVDQHVARLRQRLGMAGLVCISTVTNFGYRAENVTLTSDPETTVRGHVLRIEREFGKKPSSLVTVRVLGPVAHLTEGAKVALA